MFSTRTFIAAGAFAVALTASPVGADSLESAANDLCEKVKSCSLAELNQQDLTPEMKAMLEPMLQNMCAAMREGIREVPVEHDLYDPAVACMRSMAGLSCTEFNNGSTVETPECVKYRDMAEKAYGGS